jgi:hypothetical protein
MISHANRCIFIHIPKTAGTSIEKKLGHFEELAAGVQDHRTIRQIQPEPGEVPWLKGFFKGKAEEPTDPEKVTAKQFEAYFKFTVVRNPWARVFSWYRNVMDDPRHQEKHKVSADCTFGDFLKNHSDQWAMRLQTHWILDKAGNNPLDYVGLFEQLKESFAYISEKLNLEDAELPTLLKRRGEQPWYVDHYESESTALVAERYREEIAMFGYNLVNDF